jgi:hypothetical protein
MTHYCVFFCRTKTNLKKRIETQISLFRISRGCSEKQIDAYSTVKVRETENELMNYSKELTR